ncbi:MAG: tungstate ABC transporter substrate-binding protein TupA [Campylobacterales bacterium]|jgi:tungstate transport system substrate-binding protein|nr:tungstate ABC transporter substrate-binding protein TupA [Campylobacterales bacterium]NLM99838.1 solute-binding protein [Campylobacteraceae bacterium]
MFKIKKSLIALSAGSLIFFASMVNAAELKMATTTSTDNTGLLDALAPIFKKDTGIELKWIAVGTGNALKLGQNCDVDVLLVHAPAVEKKYVADGFGTDRTPVMYNDFVIIGDPSHKAKFEGKTIQEAFKVIEEEKIKFVSRADESGTHVKEKNVWKAALGAVPEKESWYIQAGQGMIATINIATEQKGLTFTDRGTFIKYEDNHKGNPPLVIVYEGDKNLFNYYATMAVSTKNCPNADYKGAMAFIKWISSDNIQKEIANFKLLGKQLFTPDAKTRVE